MYNSENINREQVERFKTSLRPSLKFPASKTDLLALAEALEELATEVRQDAADRAS